MLLNTFNIGRDGVKTGDGRMGTISEAPENVVLWIDAQTST